MNPNRLSRVDAPGETPAPALVNGSVPRSWTNQYAELKRLIKHKGLLNQQPAYFVGKIFLTLTLLAVGLTLLLVLQSTLLQLLNAAYLAFALKKSRLRTSEGSSALS
jgi:hypothetical protein